jgi:hypothetical protein
LGTRAVELQTNKNIAPSFENQNTPNQDIKIGSKSNFLSRSILKKMTSFENQNRSFFYFFLNSWITSESASKNLLYQFVNARVGMHANYAH